MQMLFWQLGQKTAACWEQMEHPSVVVRGCGGYNVFPKSVESKRAQCPQTQKGSR